MLHNNNKKEIKIYFLKNNMILLFTAVSLYFHLLGRFCISSPNEKSEIIHQ